MTDQTKMRVIELTEIVERDGIKGPESEYVIQYCNRSTHGLWHTLPVVRVFDRDKYQRMKDGADG